MKIIDLTHTIEEEMPVYPGTERPKIKEACTLEKDGFREAYLQFYSHTGTHMDAPGHMIKSGLYLDDFPIEQFVGKALVLEVNGQNIEKNFLEKYEKALKEVDFILFKTGWCDKWTTEAYFYDFPTLTKASAEYLLNFNLKGVGVDAISVDQISIENFEIHHLLLAAPMVLIENLNLTQVRNLDMFILTVLPLKTNKTDGSPVRAIGIYEF